MWLMVSSTRTLTRIKNQHVTVGSIQMIGNESIRNSNNSTKRKGFTIMVEAETLSRNRICQCTRRTWRAYRGNSFTPSYLTFCLSKQTLNYRKIPQYYTPWVSSQKFTFHFYYSKKFQEFHPKYVNRFMFAFLF